MIPAAPDLHWARPSSGTGTGVLVLAGSSGRLDARRADLLAASGATALALRWFGGVGQRAVPSEVPLETFVSALDLLAGECDRLAILGLSYGAEAALLTAARDPRVDAVVALSPTDVVWEGHRPGESDPPRSKWTWRGEPLRFVAMDRSWTSDGDTPAFAPYYERSRQLAGSDAVERARIPVEFITGEVVLAAGGDDQVWPSLASARAIAAHREHHGLPTTLVEDAAAGHPVVLPGEASGDMVRPYRVGGDAGSAARLGTLVWPEIRRVLRLD